MKIHTKLIFTLLVGLFFVVALAQFVQYESVINLVGKLTKDSMAILEQRELESAQNIHGSVEEALAGSLERGEMEKFSKILEAQGKVRGLLEFSLFDRQGAVAYSTHADALRREMPAEIRDKIRGSFEQLVNQNADSLEIYQPHIVNAECVRCHRAWLPGENGGTTYFKFSTAALAKSQNVASQALAETASSALRHSVWTVIGIVLVLVVLMYLSVNKFVRRPLNQFITTLEAIRGGDLSQRITFTGSDEIGQMGEALRAMVDSLRAKVELAERIADGDISAPVLLASDKDTLGQALSRMSDSLNEIISKILEASGHVLRGATHVSDASQALSQGATEQAASLEQISSTMVEVDSQTQTNAQSSGQAKNLAESVQGAAGKSSSRMQSMMNAMHEIQNSSKDVVKIVRVIDDIAFQTNLLALNAAVEAARAGKHGKGFAVVAEEVRNLAARSAKAAKETAQGIAGSMDKVEAGSQVATQTLEVLSEIAANIEKMNNLAGEISTASNEQAQSISQISTSLGQIDKVTQQNTANAEETASTAQELSEQAKQLSSLLQRFRLRKSPSAR